MATVTIKVDGRGLLNYSRAGRDAVKEVNKVVRQVLNLGRKEARQRISSEFIPRTGYLRKQARRMQTKSVVANAEVKGRVTPIPNLMNIFEHGATLANGRGYLRPRPVITPAGAVMEREAPKLFDQILKRIGT